MSKGNGDSLSSAVQESLVALLCYDKEGASRVKALVPVETFDVYFRQLADAAVKYRERYKKVPGEHTYDLVQTLQAKDKEAKSIYGRLFTSLNEIRHAINREYVIDQASRFARRQRLKAATASVINIMQSGSVDDLERAEQVLDKLRKNREEGGFEPGLLWNDPKQALSFLDREDEDAALPTGVKKLDELGLGPTRKALHLLLGLTNRGKSWWLNNLGKHALMRRKRVLHVSCEMGEQQVAQRYVQAMFAVQKRDEVVKRMKFDRDSLGRIANMSEHELHGRPHFQDPKVRSFLAGKIARVKTPLVIKQFPTGWLTLPRLEAYMDALEASINFIPDLVLIDYPDLFQIGAKNRREETGNIYMGIRGLAVERNLYLGTVSQVSKEGLKAKTINEGKVAEDWSKIHTADTVLTYNQTDEELKMGLARLFVAKAREEKKHQAILISQAYSIGQFCLESVAMGDNYWQFVDAQSSNGDDDGEED